MFWGNIVTFLSCAFWGGMSERIGRRWALMVPTFIAIFIVPLYLSTTDPTMFLILFMAMICFVGGKDALNPGWLAERFPTEVGRRHRAIPCSKARCGARSSLRC